MSGVRPKDLKDAQPFETLRKKVKDVLDGKILVGHGLSNDLKCLYTTLENPLLEKLEDISEEDAKNLSKMLMCSEIAFCEDVGWMRMCAFCVILV